MWLQSANIVTVLISILYIPEVLSNFHYMFTIYNWSRLYTFCINGYNVYLQMKIDNPKIVEDSFFFFFF